MELLGFSDTHFLDTGVLGPSGTSERGNVLNIALAYQFWTAAKRKLQGRQRSERERVEIRALPRSALFQFALGGGSSENFTSISQIENTSKRIRLHI